MIRIGTAPGAMAFLLLASVRAWSQQYTGFGDPTGEEQLVLEIINRARANPVAEGTRLSDTAVAANPSLTNGLTGGIPGGDITEGLVAPDNVVGPRPPLAMNAILLGTARAHSQEMYADNYFAHNSEAGVDPGTRMFDAGYDWEVPGGKSGENIAEAGGSAPGVHATADQLENILMIDAGEAGRGHRVNLLDTTPPPYYREIGVGYVHNDTPTAAPLEMTDLITQDFGLAPSSGPFVLGVAYSDTNGNGFYDPGEGIPGVTVSVSGVPGVFAVTASAGGYAFPADTSSGPITVQFTGGPLGTTVYSQTVTPPFPGENVKVDFNGTGIVTPPPGPPSPPPASGGGTASTGGSVKGGCGSAGLDLLWPLALLWGGRRARRA